MPGEFRPSSEDETRGGRTDPVSRYYHSQGLRLHYLDWGNEAAPPLILVHGNRDHAHSWDWTARVLRRRFHVLALDLRGHGDSQWSPDGAYLLAYHLLDLAELASELGGDSLSLLAHSFGGAVVSRYAALYPERVRRLVIVDGLGPSPEILAQWDRVGPVERTREWVGRRLDPDRGRHQRFPAPDVALARFRQANPLLSPDQTRHLVEHGLRQHPDGYSWKYDPQVRMFAPEDFALDGEMFWSKIQSPTLLCYGPKSWTTDPELDGRASAFADRRTIVFEDAGHWVHHDQLEAFVAAVDEFL